MKTKMKTKIWVVYDQDGEVMQAFKKKPTLKSIKKFFTLDDGDDINDQIARDILDTVQQTELC